MVYVPNVNHCFIYIDADRARTKLRQFLSHNCFWGSSISRLDEPNCLYFILLRWRMDSVCVGIVSFIRVIERDIRIRKYWCRMSRIRNYFVINEPSIERYMPYSIYDDKPTICIKDLNRLDCVAL
jgi:hypothetical protein